MQVTVNIEDSKLNEIVSHGIEALPQETIAELAKDAIRKALENPNTARALVCSSSYGDLRLQPWFESAITNHITEKDLSEFKDSILGAAKKDGREIILSALAEVLMRNLFSYDNQVTFRDQILSAVRSMPPPTY